MHNIGKKKIGVKEEAKDKAKDIGPVSRFFRDVKENA